MKPNIPNGTLYNHITHMDYERYIPSAFDDSMNLLQKVNQIIMQIERVTNQSNDVIDRWNDVMRWIIDEGFSKLVIETLERWYEEGRFNDIMDLLRDELTKELQALLKRIDEALKKEDGIYYQKKLMEAYFGFNGNEIFPEADYAPQGLAYAYHQGKHKLFILSSIGSYTWSASERQRITEFELKEDGSTGQPVAFSPLLDLSHQGISAYVENDQLYLYAGMNAGSDDDASKGIAKIEWKGANTTQSDIRKWQLFGNTGSNHPMSVFSKATPGVSSDGRFIVLTTANNMGTNTRYVAVYDRKAVENSTGLNATPISLFKMKTAPFKESQVVQDIACDGTYIYVVTGYVNPKQLSLVNVYDLNGRLMGNIPFEGVMGDYSTSVFNGGGSLGNPVQVEPEGITIKDGNLLILSADVWQDSNGNYTRRAKVIHELTHKRKDGFNPINRSYIEVESPAPVHLFGTSHDVSYPYGDTFQLSVWDEVRRKIESVLTLSGQSVLNLYDARDGSNTKEPATFFRDTSGGRDFAGMRANTNLENGGGINFYGAKDSEIPGTTILYSKSRDNTIRYDARLQETGQWRAGSDGEQSLGTANYRWNNLYLVGSVLQTSDRNAKQQINPIPDEVLDAWSEVNYHQFKYNQAVEEKGDEKARLHVGLIAQDIIEAFERHGLDAVDYGIVGYDEWDEQEEIRDDEGIVQPYRESGSRWAIRADECQFLEMALMRRELDQLKRDRS